jgi:hypothetical protein
VVLSGLDLQRRAGTVVKRVIVRGIVGLVGLLIALGLLVLGAGRGWLGNHEEPAPGVNADNLRCEFDEKGECVKLNLCGGPDAREDDCLAEHEPRAWSSPIFVDFRTEG